jgi:hypothetical protein
VHDAERLLRRWRKLRRGLLAGTIPTQWYVKSAYYKECQILHRVPGSSSPLRTVVSNTEVSAATQLKGVE